MESLQKLNSHTTRKQQNHNDLCSLNNSTFKRIAEKQLWERGMHVIENK